MEDETEKVTAIDVFNFQKKIELDYEFEELTVFKLRVMIYTERGDIFPSKNKRGQSKGHNESILTKREDFSSQLE